MSIGFVGWPLALRLERAGHTLYWWARRQVVPFAVVLKLMETIGAHTGTRSQQDEMASR